MSHPPPRGDRGRVAADTRLAVERFRLLFFTVRHVVGVAVFLWLTVLCFRLDAPQLGYLFLVLTPVYAVFAFVSGRSLFRRWRHLSRSRIAANVLNNGEDRHG